MNGEIVLWSLAPLVALTVGAVAYPLLRRRVERPGLVALGYAAVALLVLAILAPLF